MLFRFSPFINSSFLFSSFDVVFLKELFEFEVSSKELIDINLFPLLIKFKFNFGGITIFLLFFIVLFDKFDFSKLLLLLKLFDISFKSVLFKLFVLLFKFKFIILLLDPISISVKLS